MTEYTLLLSVVRDPSMGSCRWLVPENLNSKNVVNNYSKYFSQNENGKPNGPQTLGCNDQRNKVPVKNATNTRLNLLCTHRQPLVAILGGVYPSGLSVKPTSLSSDPNEDVGRTETKLLL